MQITQDDRIGELKTPLGKDVLCLRDFSGVESLGECFEFHVNAVSTSDHVDFDKALGSSCTVSLKSFQGKKRFFNGILTQAQSLEQTEDLFGYRLVLRPWFWLLGNRANCRIFLNKNVKDILTEVFKNAGLKSFEFKTTASYDKIPYCVQYREDDRAFCTRLMEEYGLYYYFKHSDDTHVMILADSAASHQANPDLPTLRVRRGEEEQRIDAWTSERTFRTGKIKFNDYDYLKPGKKLVTSTEANEKYNNSKLEVYDFPGKYTEEDAGNKFAKIRLEAEQCKDHRRYVDGKAALVFPGSRQSVSDNPVSSENQDYLVVHCVHRFGSQYYRSSSGVTEQEVYHGTYEFLPFDRPFRMLPVTPKPRIYGVQTAKVIGKKGEEYEEISTDENGHIWVRFFWDLEQQTSCPVRVAQFWSGKKWGGQHIPRVGMEVVVEFIEGDPDRPLVVGAVYNGDNKYPYDLPGHKTQSGVKSDSTKGHNGYNELMFEDQKGHELFRIHAEKDQDIHVNNDVTEDVGNNSTESVGKDKVVNVGMDTARDLAKGGGNLKINTFNSITMKVGPKEMPLTSIKMTPQDITLAVGPEGMPMTSIVMTMTDITLGVGPQGLMGKIVIGMQGITSTVMAGLTTQSLTPASASLMSPNITETAMAAISMVAPAGVTAAATLNTPALVAGGAIVGGIPI